MSADAGVVVGIDLGTTHSLVAVVEQGRPRVLLNGLGEPLTPSAVSLHSGEVLVGAAARARASTHPAETALAFKRDMGLERKIQLGAHAFSPPELSAIVLRGLRDDAEARLGRPIAEAVITVPAYFNDAQRRATHEAAQIAGLKVERLLNEPTAAAIAYGLHQREREQRSIVLDLGGGTFDVTVLEIIEGVVEVQATAGDTRLGGDDFTAALVERVASDAKLQHKLDLETPGTNRARLWEACERAKKLLSRSTEARLFVPRLTTSKGREVNLDHPLFRSLAEVQWQPLLERVRSPIARALRDAGLAVTDVDEVLLVGGATRMPCFLQLVEQTFGKPALHHLPPDEAVALGAAVQAALKTGDGALEDVVVTDIAPFSLGVAIATDYGGFEVGDIFSPILERGTVIPASRVGHYSTRHHGQREINVEVYQGEHAQCDQNFKLGELNIGGLPPGPAGSVAIDIRFTYDLNGLLEVEVTNLADGKKKNTLLEHAPGRLGEHEIERARRGMEALKFHPRDALPNTAALTQAEALYAELIGMARGQLGQAIARFRWALETQDSGEISAARNDLKELVKALGG